VACGNTPTNVRFKTSTAVKPCVLQVAGNGVGVLRLNETETQVRCCIIDK
jgi:hypothetical protein